VVTGAARGIGAAIALGLALRGAHVVAVDRNDASATLRDITDAGGQCSSFIGDVSSEAEVARLGSEIRADCGGVDILVNHAGINVAASLDETDFALWRQVLSTNLDSQFLMIKEFASDMIAGGWGRIVNVSSGSIYTTTPGLTAYMASKAGVLGLTSGLANDLGTHGITVNAVSPPFVRTQPVEEAIAAGAFPPDIDVLIAQTQAIKRPGRPDDLVGTIAFLTSEDGAFVTGKFLVADGGASRVF